MISWVLRDVMYTEALKPLLAEPQRGDYMMIAPPASKADPFDDVVWGCSPIFVPFAPHAPIRAFEAVAAIFFHDDAPPTPAHHR
eukprot:6202358-Pleurochrysis_carterae.AAC.1